MWCCWWKKSLPKVGNEPDVQRDKSKTLRVSSWQVIGKAVGEGLSQLRWKRDAIEVDKVVTIVCAAQKFGLANASLLQKNMFESLKRSQTLRADRALLLSASTKAQR